MNDPEKSEGQPQVRSDAGLAALMTQYTSIKICQDEEDGYWLEWQRWESTGGWEVMDDDLENKYTTIHDAICAAIRWHNGDLKQHCEWRGPISTIAANDKLSDPAMKDSPLQPTDDGRGRWSALLARIETMTNQDIQLLCGEMSRQELRTVRALLDWVAREMRANAEVRDGECEA